MGRIVPFDSQEIHCALLVHKLFRAHSSLRFAYVLFDVRNRPVCFVRCTESGWNRISTHAVVVQFCLLYLLVGVSDFFVADRSAVIVVRVRVCSWGVLNLTLTFDPLKQIKIPTFISDLTGSMLETRRRFGSRPREHTKSRFILTNFQIHLQILQTALNAKVGILAKPQPPQLQGFLICTDLIHFGDKIVLLTKTALLIHSKKPYNHPFLSHKP